MKVVVIYLLLMVVGLVVLAWPEENNLMMVKFSDAHGPSTLDLVGIGIIFLGYIPLIIPVFTRFELIQTSIGKRLSSSMVVGIVLFSATIALGLLIGSDMLLGISVVLSTLLQTVFVYLAYKK